MIPQIIAHRGASYLAPENTLAAFRKAMEIGADGVEMDVQKTLDGGLVIHHDYIIDLHTDISGRIYDMTEGELKDLDFGSWKDVAYKDEKIATLAEALALCRSMEGCTVQLELKSTMDNDPAFVSGVVDAIRAADIADRLVLSFVQPRPAAAGQGADAGTAGGRAAVRRIREHGAAAAGHLEGPGPGERHGG